MLRVLGGPKRLCSGVTRRDLLLAGSLGFIGVNPVLAGSKREGGATFPNFGKAKNIILLYLFGGPSHLETWDMKPSAPVEIRGDFKPIATSLPGCQVNEHLPRIARIMDKVTVVRSLTHPWNFHGMQYATTGLPVGSIPVEETDVHPLHQPFLGSVKIWHDQHKQGRKARGAVPDNILLPFTLSSKRPAARYAKPYGSFLGNTFDPIATEFKGDPTRSMVRRSHGPATEIWDPYLGVKPGCRFSLAPEAELTADITFDRLNRRKSLLEQMESSLRLAGGEKMAQQRELAFSLLDSPAVRHAFALEKEPLSLREAYGMSLFGQATLQARRLVESGCKFVTVVWDEFGQLNAGWDTHVDHYNRLKNELLPGFDLAFSALVQDLETRGMLDDTLVLVMNEMGRTPRFEGDGRGHWGHAYSNMFVGAGIQRGQVVGKTDRIGGIVTDRPVSAKDVLATIYHLAGIDPRSVLIDKLNRPVPLVHDGQVIPEMLA
ncbi:MAG: DUF1501 domain-containing protein [Gemmataceae bacterium]|nr:DUF1501 domain-containing protein [Gemmataceae bacterium]